MGGKPAKRTPSFSGKERPDTGARMVAVSAGHAIGDRVHMTARCGVPLSGWGYAAPDQVACPPCREAVVG